MKKEQFNIQLPPKLAAQVRADARRNGKTLDDVTAAIFGDFFGGWTLTERAKFYGGAKAKCRGRKVGGEKTEGAQ
jgi:hypothetical protein